jgi:hypothetical protein
MPNRTPRPAKGDLSLIAILAASSVLQFGGLFWPPIGTLWTLLNAAVLATIVTCGMLTRATRTRKRSVR